MSKIIGIVGSRSKDSATDLHAVEQEFLSAYKDGDWICTGGCPQGGDRFAKIIHLKHVIPYLEFPANWNKHGKSAGPKRNSQIAKFSDILIACLPDDSVHKGGSRWGGADDTVTKFKTMYPNRKVILI